MLNKQLLTVAIVSILCCVAVQVDGAKPAKGGGGGGNHMQRGIQLAQEKHYDAAAEEFGKAIKDKPNDPRGYANRGTAYRQGARAAMAAGDSEGASTRYQSALADFAKYIELAPKDASAYTEHGQTLSELKQYDAALADFNKALELKPDDLNTIKFRGFAEIGLNQWDKAVADFSAVIQKKPDDLQSYDRRALAYRSMKNYDAAIAEYQQALDRIDQFAFVIGLQPLELDTQDLGVGPQHRLDLGECRAAVDLRLALSQEIEVGTIENRETHDQRLRFCSQSWNWSRSSSPPAPGGAPAGRGVAPDWAGPPP